MLKYVQKIAPPDTRHKQEAFHCAKDQTLAPQHNKAYLDKFNIDTFDHLLNEQPSDCKHYLAELSDGTRVPHRRKSHVRPLRPHLLQFREHIRPPYWGTWQKRSSKVTGRRPFGLDTDRFDYEVDSELEWDIGGPGESLHGDDSDDPEGPEEDYEIDMKFFVPHGYVSDDEMDRDSDQEENKAGATSPSHDPISNDSDDEVMVVYDSDKKNGINANGHNISINNNNSNNTSVTHATAPKAAQANNTTTHTGRFELKPIVLGLTFNDNDTISTQKLEFMKTFEAGLCVGGGGIGGGCVTSCTTTGNRDTTTTATKTTTI